MRKFDKDFNDEGASAEINISPLIDVIFILLIFFIVTMSFSNKNALDLDVPSADNSGALPADSATIEIDGGGKIYVGGQPCPISALSLKIARMKPSKVVVYADKSTRADLLVSVLDEVKSAGVKSVFVATVKK